MSEKQLIEKLSSLVVLDREETADEAFERFKQVTKLLGYASCPSYKQEITIEELENEEERLNFKLPQSYKDFVTKHGLISYAEPEREMLFPFRTLTEALMDEDDGWDMSQEEIEEAYEDIEIPNNLIIFSYGDDSLQKEYYHCFDKDGEVYDFCQDDLGYARDYHDTFDDYLQWATNAFIVNFLESECDYKDFDNWRDFY